MRKIVFVVFFLSVFASGIRAQDIANVDVAARIQRSKSIYVSIGTASVLGKTLGDYGSGFNLEAGYMKRLNRVLSIGGSLSYLSFKYDAAKTYPYYYNPDTDDAIELALTGGNVSLLSAGFNLKINIIPVKDDSKFSIYGIATPFVSLLKRTEVSGQGVFYSDDDGDGVYDTPTGFVDQWTSSDFPALKKDSKVTGGVNVGFGVELFPAKAISAFAQVSYGYTFPITYVATQTYLHSDDVGMDTNGRAYYNDTNDLQKSYYNPNFPIIKQGFSSVTIKLGVAYNF